MRTVFDCRAVLITPAIKYRYCFRGQHSKTAPTAAVKSYCGIPSPSSSILTQVPNPSPNGQCHQLQESCAKIVPPPAPSQREGDYGRRLRRLHRPRGCAPWNPTWGYRPLAPAWGYFCVLSLKNLFMFQ